ncbi:MAG: Na+/H+ antiporter NhaC family protein [Bacteroidales bacterium]|nr:Na+/H+ antiporter NhaC family protein [Bacteroidales bacterium]
MLRSTSGIDPRKPAVIIFLTLALIFLTGPLLVAEEHDSLLFPHRNSLKVDFEDIIVQHVATTIQFTVTGEESQTGDRGKYLPVMLNDSLVIAEIINNKAEVRYVPGGDQTLVIVSGDFRMSRKLSPVPLWMSILPPLIAIMMALIFREVFSALFVGLLIGTSVIMYYQGMGFFLAVFNGIFAIIDTYVLESLLDSSHQSISVFSMMIGAMVTLISDNGGMKGVVNKLSAFAGNARSGQLTTWLLGIAIFFDDYANTLVVGNTMRPVTDKLKISREKLSYIVDSTAAPVAAIAFVTTWIGAELSYIQDGIKTLGLNESAYTVFLNSLSYSFYPVLTLIFIFILIMTGRDFGPMFRAEVRARRSQDGDIENETGVPDKKASQRWYNAALPVFVVIGGTITGLVITGLETTVWDKGAGISRNISTIIGNSDSFRALLWSSLAGIIVAVLLTLTQRLMTLRESMESLVSGFKTMVTAILILVMAWGIALITKDLHTADFISGLLTSLNLTPYLIPAITFILAAFVSFSTGSSWGTMAILYPLLLPSAWLIARETGLDYDRSMSIFHNVVSAVLAGSVLGDHCSPISDTTILSSLASSCNHIDHVRTQLPYALTVGTVAVFVGTIPSAYGAPFYVTLPLSAAILYLAVVIVGKKTILSG